MARVVEAFGSDSAQAATARSACLTISKDGENEQLVAFAQSICVEHDIPSVLLSW